MLSKCFPLKQTNKTEDYAKHLKKVFISFNETFYYDWLFWNMCLVAAYDEWQMKTKFKIDSKIKLISSVIS